MDNQDSLLLLLQNMRDEMHCRFGEIQTALVMLNQSLSDLKSESISARKDIDTAHTKIRALEDAIKPVQTSLVILEEKHKEPSWTSKVIDEVRGSFVKGMMTFLLIFSLMSLGNVKPTLEKMGLMHPKVDTVFIDRKVVEVKDVKVTKTGEPK